MGKRGPLAKPPGRAVGHRSPAPVVRLVSGPVRTVPRAPEGLLASTRRDWKAFWEGPKSQLVTPDMLPALVRLFRMRDDYEREYLIYRESRLVKGSVGQIRMNPLGGHILALETAIARLENEFGLTPMSASRLGLVYGEAAKSLDDLNRRLDERDDDTPDDPTAALLIASADGRRTQAADARA